MKTAAIIGISNYARNHLLMALEQALHGKMRRTAATIVQTQRMKVETAKNRCT